MEGLREWLAERNGNGAARFWQDLTDTPPQFVRARRALERAMAKPATPASLLRAAEIFGRHDISPTEMLAIAAKRKAFNENNHVKVLMHLSELECPKLSRAEVDATLKDDVERDPTDRAARVVATLAAGGVDALARIFAEFAEMDVAGGHVARGGGDGDRGGDALPCGGRRRHR